MTSIKPVAEPITWRAFTQPIIREGFKKAGFTDDEVKQVSKLIFKQDKKGELRIPRYISYHRICKLYEPTLQKLEKCFVYIGTKIKEEKPHKPDRQGKFFGKSRQENINEDFNNGLYFVPGALEGNIRTIRNELSNQDEIVEGMLKLEKSPKKALPIINANPQLKEKFMNFMRAQFPTKSVSEIQEMIEAKPKECLERFEKSISHELALEPNVETQKIIKPLQKKEVTLPDSNTLKDTVLKKRKRTSNFIKAALATGPTIMGVGFVLMFVSLAFPPLLPIAAIVTAVGGALGLYGYFAPK